MKRINVLDCTFRDGGYVNDWEFGYGNGKSISDLIWRSGVDFIEVGFIDKYEYQKDHFKFSEMSQITDTFRPSPCKLAAMINIGYGYPLSKIPPRSDKTVDLIRVVMWKRLLKEGVEYCKALKDKGYDVSVQATRTDQYSLEEFKVLINMFNELQPYSLYIVDTFGLFDKESLLEYIDVADSNLTESARLGYHAHNNMQQAFSNMLTVAEHNCNHKLMFDASVLGMGRGAGNLCLELLLKYLNEKGEGEYNEEPLMDVAENYILPFYRESPWGYSYPYLLSAKNKRNPEYVSYLMKAGLSIPQIAKAFELMREREVGITYDTQMCDKLIDEITHNRDINS